MPGLSDDFVIILLSMISFLLVSVLAWILWKIILSRNIEHRLQKHLEHKEYEKVIEWAKGALEKKPSFFVPYYLARALDETEKWGEALKYYQQASSMINHNNNMYQSILLQMGRLQLKLNNKDQALSYFLLINQVDENYFESQYEVALIFYAKKQFSKCHDVLKSILDLKPGLINARFLYGKILYEMAQYSFSLKQFELLEKHDSQNPLVYYYKALNLDNSKMYSSAVKALRQYLEFEDLPKQEKEKAQIRLIQLYIKLKDIEGGLEAITDILDQINTGPNQAEIHYLHAHLLWNRGQEYDALKEYEKVFLIDPRYKDIQNIYDKYKKLFSRESLKKYFTINEHLFERSCHTILGLNDQDLLYRSLHYYMFGRGKNYSIFFRHIEPLSFTTLTALEVLAASFQADLQYIEIYALGGTSSDARGHALLKRAVIIEKEEFLKAAHRLLD